MTDRELLNRKATSVLLSTLVRASEHFFTREPYLITDQGGFKVTEMEAVLRPLWGLGPIIDGELTVEAGQCTKRVDALIREIILCGTDETRPEYFSRYADSDPISFANQAVTELAGYAVALHFARKYLWDPYDEREKKQVGDWMAKWAVTGLRHSWENNHFWFPILVLTALDKIGVGVGDVDADLRRAFSVLDSMYIGDGWVIEAASTQSGVIKSKVSASKWSHWGELKGVKYAEPEPLPAGYAEVTGTRVALRKAPTTQASIIMRLTTEKAATDASP